MTPSDFRAISRLKIALACVWPLAAVSAEQTIRRLDPGVVPFHIWMWVLGLSLIGFLISSAEDLFGWVERRSAREAGKLVARLAGSVAAGFIAWVLAAMADLQQLVALISVTPAAYAGESYIRRLAERKAESDGAALERKGP